MGSMGNPKTWVPHMNNRDCSKGLCSLYCPQWCYIVFPPPPPSDFFANGPSNTKFSPLVIAVMGILASAFLLVSYYTIISKYCGTRESSRRRDQSQVQSEDLEDNHNPSLHEPWETKMSGLDEALIKTIAVFKYKKGDGLIGEADCAVCLSEFEEEESLRLLPKCSHAFHVQCIDKWLKSHSNCPLCRANIIFIAPLPPPVTETPSANELSGDNDNIAPGRPEVERLVQNEVNEMPKISPSRVFSDLGDFQRREVVIEIRDEECPQIRRSVSMDHSCQIRVADILQDEEVGSSKPSPEVEKSGGKKRIKRSFSGGRFCLIRQGGARDAIIPL